MLIPKQNIPLSNMKSQPRPFREPNQNQNHSLILISTRPLLDLKL